MTQDPSRKVQDGLRSIPVSTYFFKTLGIGIAYYCMLLLLGCYMVLHVIALGCASSRVLGRAGLGGWLGLKCYGQKVFVFLVFWTSSK